MRAIIEYRHAILMALLSYFLLAFEPIVASQPVGYLCAVMVPMFVALVEIGKAEERNATK